jgi:hypothetical protein
MQIEPGVTVARFEQLSPGRSLHLSPGRGIVCRHEVEDPTRDGDQLMLVMGPAFPAGLTWPSLVGAPAATVISFGKEYVLRLPSDVNGWAAGSPSADPIASA